jgi:hypothetical protein
MNLTVCQYDGFSMQSTFIVRWLGTLSPIITFFEADSERNLYWGGEETLEGFTNLEKNKS